ncbi:polysaccharide deacetylase family protein [Azospirillum doebereinerae]|uniref:Chitooligosaccharide deacetylase n=1 Tax=Azospirillum doebereinerae TaxID=92933 RepID=A0A3S0WNP8_9PROT|nr:polysaccharide deacetylase family protein [Azospirillum doebereinerae]MCG5241477.1 polysaccharide deacetylase family protein [Azospirillum doebereinerae]RUQ74446.1 polysaccharide deacetylase family protein [Azospirillum doebereinerae]
MKQAIAGMVRWTGFGALLRFLKARRGVTIVVYHDPKPEVLREHLAWYKKHYTFTTLDAVASAMETGRWGDLPPYPLVVTFDDGHRNNTALAPLFRQYDLRPTVYLCSRVVGTARPYWWKTEAAGKIGVETLKRVPDAERRRLLAEAGDDPDQDAAEIHAMSWDEVARMTDVSDFGAHTRTHPILLQCDDRLCAEEIGLSRVELEDALGRPCRHFAFPNGDFSEREVAEIRNAGYRTARTIDPGWNDAKTDPLRLKAFPLSDDASVDWLTVQLTGIPAWLRKWKTPAPPARPDTETRNGSGLRPDSAPQSAGV